MPVTPEECLPEFLRGPDTTISRIAAGLSGAAVYRVNAADKSYVLKISAEHETRERWLQQVNIRELAASANVSPRVVHTDELRRAVVSEFVEDRSFPAYYFDPRTHEAALANLGQTLRRVHEIPLPANAGSKDPRALLESTWSDMANGFPLPPFAVDAVLRVLNEQEPVSERAVVLSHNDVNPSNLVYDGSSLWLLDWDTAGANDPFYDLAAIAVFARMDNATCQRLIAAHDDAPAEPIETALPARFQYFRRLIAAMAGVLFLNLARNNKHPGANGDETLDATLSLGEFYQQLRAGTLSPATAPGQWAFGLALIKTSVAV